MESTPEKKGMKAWLKSWIYVNPPPLELTEAEIQMANEKLAVLEKHGYGLFPIVGVEPAKQALFTEYFFQESQSRLLKNNFQFILIKVSRNLAGFQGPILVPLMKALHNSISERKALAEEFPNFLSDLKAYIAEAEAPEGIEYYENSTVETDEVKRGTSKEKKGGGKITAGAGLAKGEVSVEGSTTEGDERKKTTERATIRKGEIKSYAIPENTILNEFEHYLEKLSNHQILFLYDWLYEVRKNDDGEIVENRMSVTTKVTSIKESWGCFGWLLWPITILVAIAMWIGEWFVPTARDVARKNPNIRGNPLGVKVLRPFFVLRSVTSDNIEKDSATLKILKSLAHSEFAIFLLYTDAEIEQKLK